MNERIKELAKNAGLKIDGYGDPIWGCLIGDEKTEFLEKFAELIIHECRKAALSGEHNFYFLGRINAVEDINKHFGVE